MRVGRVSRRRALLRSIAPRNNQPETHPDDERGRWPQGWRLHRMERFPNASENSYRKLPGSGILVVSLELGGRQIAESRMGPLLVVDLLQELADQSARLHQVPVFVAMYLFVLECFHERFAGCVVPGVALTRHADGDAVMLQQIGVVGAGVLRAPVRVMDQSRLDHAP